MSIPVLSAAKHTIPTTRVWNVCHAFLNSAGKQQLLTAQAPTLGQPPHVDHFDVALSGESERNVSSAFFGRVEE